jgi:hypothetical protein
MLKRVGLAMLLCVASSAWATQDFVLQAQGNGVTFVDGNRCPTCNGLVVGFHWTGAFDITTTGGDGTFSRDSLLLFSGSAAVDPPVDFAVFGFDFASDGNGNGLNGLQSPFQGFGPPPVVTVENGAITSIVGQGFFQGQGQITFAGLSVSFTEQSFHAGSTNAGGTVTSVPEPGTWLLLIAGLALLTRTSSSGSRSPNSRSRAAGRSRSGSPVPS